MISFTIVPVGLFTIALLLFNLLRAPYASDREQQEQIRHLSQRCEAKIEPVFGYGPPFEQVDTIENQTWRLFRIGVKNLSSINTVEGVRVVLEKIDNVTNPLLPLELAPKLAKPLADNQDYPKEFRLDPGAVQYVDVVQRCDTSQSEIILCYATRNIPSMIPAGDYVLRLGITAMNIPKRDLICQIAIIDNRLSFVVVLPGETVKR